MNRLPQPVLQVSTLSGGVGTTIEFDATDSMNPDSNNLRFEGGGALMTTARSTCMSP